MAEDDNDKDLRARLEALSSGLEAQQKAAQGRKVDTGASEAASRSMSEALSLGLRVLTEFVAAIAVAGLIGWKIDEWSKTAPLFLILFLALGTATGFWNVYRIAVQPMGKKGGS